MKRSLEDGLEEFFVRGGFPETARAFARARNVQPGSYPPGPSLLEEAFAWDKETQNGSSHLAFTPMRVTCDSYVLSLVPLPLQLQPVGSEKAKKTWNSSRPSIGLSLSSSSGTFLPFLPSSMNSSLPLVSSLQDASSVVFSSNMDAVSAISLTSRPVLAEGRPSARAAQMTRRFSQWGQAEFLVEGRVSSVHCCDWWPSESVCVRTVVGAVEVGDVVRVMLWSWGVNGTMEILRTLLEDVPIALLRQVQVGASGVHHNGSRSGVPRVATVMPHACLVHSAETGVSIGQISLPKHDLTCVCWAPFPDGPLALCGAHVKSAEGKVVSWRRGQKDMVTLFQFTGGHIVDMKTSGKSITPSSTLCLLLQNDMTIHLARWCCKMSGRQQQQEDKLILLANIRVPCVGQTLSMHFTSVMDVVIYAHGTICVFDLATLMDLNDINNVSVVRCPQPVRCAKLDDDTSCNKAIGFSLDNREVAVVCLSGGRIGVVDVESMDFVLLDRICGSTIFPFYQPSTKCEDPVAFGVHHQGRTTLLTLM